MERSILRCTAGLLKARSLSTTMKSPLLRARSLIFSIVSKTVLKSAGELITSWTGRPPVEPGSGGRLKAKRLIPATWEIFACTSGSSSPTERLRSFQGFRIMPEMLLLRP